MLSVIHAVGFRLSLPGSWNHLSPSGGGQRGQQLLVFTEHENISETGVGQSSAGSADTEQVVTQDHCSSYRHRGALRESLIYAGERGGEGEGKIEKGNVSLPKVILSMNYKVPHLLQ